MFDETYYVKDAYTLSHLGYEGSWPADANLSFNAGHPEIYLDSPSFVAHPPIGKWIIALGLALFGAGDPFGWRISVAVCGILLVLVTMLLAKRLFRSTLLAVIAGGLIAIDGNAIVMSRVALLDTMLALFALLGAGAVLLDREGNRATPRRLDVVAGPATASGWGPVFWSRPWLLVAGVAFGIASGIKWSGLYFLAVFAVYALVSEVLARRRAGIRVLARRHDAAPGAGHVPADRAGRAAVYVAELGGLVRTDRRRRLLPALDRERRRPGLDGLLSWVPLDIQNWWHYQASMYGYHVNEHTPHTTRRTR